MVVKYTKQILGKSSQNIGTMRTETNMHLLEMVLHMASAGHSAFKRHLQWPVIRMSIVHGEKTEEIVLQ